MSHQLRALAVDDEPAIARTVRMALQGSGWVVDTAASGEEALECFAADPYDLVLLDLRLPGIQGTEVLRRLVADHPVVRVVIMSAYGTAECALETMRLGAADILRKPFTPDELRAVVDSVMRRDLDPEDVEHHFQEDVTRAREHIREQRIPAALELARHAVALYPDRPEGYHLVGVCHDLLGERAEAEKMYHLAIEVEPDYRPAKQNLDRLVFFRGTRGSVDIG